MSTTPAITTPESGESVLPPTRRDSLGREGLKVLAIFALVLIVYSPALSGGFVWDDLMMVENNNPLQTGHLTLASVWFRMDFPLTTVSFWLEGLLFGKQPAGYHVVNVLLHALNCVLVWRLLARLKIPGAWWAGLIFAVHPVCVASAAWISEQKNTLSLAFYLLSFICYLNADEANEPDRAEQPGTRETIGEPKTEGLLPAEPVQSSRRFKRTLWYILSLLTFVLALFSKTSTVVLPVILLGWLVWRDKRLTLSSLLRTAPYFALSLTFGLMSIWFQKHQTMAGSVVHSETVLGRILNAGRALWFYFGNAVWPFNLNMIYPRWTADVGSPWSYLPYVLVCILLLICWRWRTSWGRHLLFGFACFAVSLAPILGLLDMYYLVISRVSDHFAYLAMVPMAAMLATFASWMAGRIKGNRGVQNRVSYFLPLALVLGLSILSFQRARVFATDEGLWRDTLAKNPTAWPAHNNLACILAERQRFDEAADHFAASLQFNPSNAKAHANLGALLAQKGDFAGAELHFSNALKLKPNDGPARRMFASYLASRDHIPEAISNYREALRLWPDNDARLEFAGLLQHAGNTREAIDQYRLLAAQQPPMPGALNNLAWLLATSADSALRNGPEAVNLAERACRLTDFKEALPVGTLAAAYAEVGRFENAVASAQQAIQLANAAGNQQFASANQQLLRLYRAGRPYHERPAQPRPDAK